MASRHPDPRRFADDRRDRGPRDRRDVRYRDDRNRDRYERDSYRRRSRSRSPQPHRRRERSRDGHAHRYHDREPDRERDRERDRDRDRERERDRQRDRPRDYPDRVPPRPREEEHRDRDRDSRRPGSAASGTPGADAKRPHVEDPPSHNKKPRREQEPQEDETEKKKKARLEKWLEKKKELQEAKGSPNMTTGTPTAPASPALAQPKQDVQSPPDAKDQPAQGKDVNLANVQMRLPKFKSLQVDKNPNGDTVGDDQDGLSRDKHNPLQDEATDKKNKLVRLDEWQDQQAEDMDTAEDVDPLDAFMEELDTTAASADDPTAQRGQAMFSDETEPNLPAPVGDDILALAPKRKKKDIPVVDHSKQDYKPFRKAFYIEPTEISELTKEEVADLRLELDGIKVKPADVPRPVIKWAQMGLSQPTLDMLQRVGYSRPTSIQAQAIPVILSGKNMIGVAKTGSGKTLAFGIPIIRHILDQNHWKPSDGPISLILAPTRELSLQIVEELKPFFQASQISIACAYGGAPISDQIAEIKRGVQVLCATPGRLIDLLQSNQGRVLPLRSITYVVIDEADRMFDMGFAPQINKVLGNIRPDRQTVLFSATFPKSISDLARKSLEDPAEVIIGGLSVVPPEITQIVTVVPPSAEKKMAQVLLRIGKLFDDNEDARALVFVERQEMAEDLLNRCFKRGYPCMAIHGGKDQNDRKDAINQFKAGIISLLIATSVAARGIDVVQLKMVINYDCPTHLEDYVHRCGRTGRAGNTGTAVTLIERPGQERFAVHLVKALKQSRQKIPEDLKAMADEFMEKVKAGTEKWFDPGFGGKGLDKLDAARTLEKKREKRAHKGEFGDDSDSETEIVPPVVSANPATPAADAPNAVTPEEPAYMQLLRNKPIVHKTERAETSKPLTAMERVKAAASSVNGRLSKKGMIHHGQPIDNKGPDAGAFHSTIEINDFPQKARWAVTNRTNVAKILEQTGTSITTKGNYYPTGTGPTQDTDLPKLYILVEGDTENVVSLAMLEITRLLKEATDAAAEAVPRGATGRYSVM